MIHYKSIQTILTVYHFSLTGIFQTPWTRGLLGLIFLIPPFAFLSLDYHFANEPFELFMGFQSGFQRYFILMVGFIFLRDLWRTDEYSGIQRVLKSAGVSQASYRVGKHAAVATIVSIFQGLLSTYVWALTLVWERNPGFSETIKLCYHGTFLDIARSGLANALMVCLVLFLIRMIWLITEQMLLAYIAGSVLLLAGWTQPVWVPYFQYSQEIATVFTYIGKILQLMVPAFWKFDLWLMAQRAPDLDPSQHLKILISITLLWTLLIHITSWFVTFIKRT